MLNENEKEFEYWNDTSIAHMFTRLITKTNHPYNNTPLLLDEFNKDYNLLKNFIEWRKKYRSNPVKIGVSLYNFTNDNMLLFYN
jgi:hypothetical protein